MRPALVNEPVPAINPTKHRGGTGIGMQKSAAEGVEPDRLWLK